MFTMCQLLELHLSECHKCREKVLSAVSKVNASLAGSVKTAKKSKSSRENGKLGGRPKKL